MNAREFFLDDETFAAFQAYIYDLTGIHYTQAKRFLLDTRIKKRATAVGVEDGSSYLDFLKSHPDRKRELEELIDQVSTNETSFFRHQQQIDVFLEIVSDLVADRRSNGSKNLKFWSAACSSGEEPYTLAMLVQELLKGEAGWKISFTGTDISSAVIDKAKAGSYSERTARNVPEPYLKYFQSDSQDPQEFTLVPEIARMVRFDVLSLIDEPRMRTMRNMDIIFCRNVLIYFDANAKKKVLNYLLESLAPEGYLVLGPSDSLYGLTDAFQRTPYSVYNFYQRPQHPAASPPASASTQTPQPTQPPARPAPASPPQSLREKMLIMRLDGGFKDLDKDLNGALEKVIEAFGTVSEAILNLSQAEGLDGQLRTELSRADRQIVRIMMFLQVGDRAHQKIEALRGILQELSDRLLGSEKEAPDLQVQTSSYDEKLLPASAEKKETASAQEDETMSQDDIDALFE